MPSEAAFFRHWRTGLTMPHPCFGSFGRAARLSAVKGTNGEARPSPRRFRQKLERCVHSIQARGVRCTDPNAALRVCKEATVNPTALRAPHLRVRRLAGFPHFQAHAARHGFSCRLRGAHTVNERRDLPEARLVGFRRTFLGNGFRRCGPQLPQPEFPKQDGAAKFVTPVDLAADGENIAWRPDAPAGACPASPGSPPEPMPEKCFQATTAGLKASSRDEPVLPGNDSASSASRQPNSIPCFESLRLPAPAAL